MSRGEDAGKREAQTPAAMRSNHHEPLSVFDRFATVTSRWVSQAWFFTTCLLLVVIWVPSFFVLRNIDTWQLVINTVTTIITFLLVALLQTPSRAPTKRCSKS
jgi:low affinity Fe/Cu permease